MIQLEIYHFMDSHLTTMPKEKNLNKGLDLKGGINVILQISVKDILKGLADYTKNPTFNQALDDADLLQKSY